MKQKKVTIKDIAETANVSKSTVSRVLNDTTPVNEKKREAVLEAMRKLDFKPNVFARSLAGGKSMTIGVVTQNIGSPFYDQVTHAIVKSLTNTSYSPLIADGQWHPEAERVAIQTLVGRQVDGLIIVGGLLTESEIFELNDSKPTVIVARDLESDNIPCIYADNLRAAFDATTYLIECGHEKIAHITGIKTHQDAIRRFRGYQKALEHAKIEYDPGLIYEGNFSGQSGVLAVESLLSSNGSFSAIFSANDEMAYGARLALYRRGIRVPDDISIIGFDDQPLSSYVTPPLTTVRQPSDQLGANATEVLMNAINGEPAEPKIFGATVVHRESVLRRR